MSLSCEENYVTSVMSSVALLIASLCKKKKKQRCWWYTDLFKKKEWYGAYDGLEVITRNKRSV